MRTIKPILFFVLFGSAVWHAYGQGKPDSTRRTNMALIKIDSLQAAIVTAVLKPRIKGDTVEYNTKKFRMQQNATVEELLRRLPGLQIDINGNITYNGQVIQHLLVDGEDIFTADPTLVTRNFDANKIERVQVIDRKSDEAVFTGIDDGTRAKAINLVIKESAKDGYFGKAEVGGNIAGSWSSDLAAAAFRNKEQFAALGLTSNTGNLGFTNNTGASVGFFSANNDALGASAGTGIPRFQAAALHYANSWNGQGDHAVGNYQYSNYYANPVGGTVSVQMEPDGVYGQSVLSQSRNRQNQHWGYAVFDLSVNRKSALKFALRGSDSRGENRLDTRGTGSFNDTLVNSGRRAINDEVNQRNLSADLAWRTQIGKRAERLLSVNMGATSYDNRTSGYLNSTNSFYKSDGSLLLSDTVDQRKQIELRSSNVSGGINFLEPLWKDAAIGMSYWVSYIRSEPLQATYSRGDGKYQTIVDSLSSNLRMQVVRQKGSLSLQGKDGHLTYTFGSDFLVHGYYQHDLMSDSFLHFQYFSWSPRMFLTYVLSQVASCGVSYATTIQQPTESQLEPLKNNSNPLQVWIGNAGLRPSVSQNFGIEYRRFKTWMVSLRANVGLTKNSISTRTTTDSLGRQVSQWMNVDGGRMAGTDISINRRVLGFDVGLHTGITYSRAVNYLNADLSRNSSYTAEGGFGLNKYVAQSYSLQLNTRFMYFSQRSSINSSSTVHYWTQIHQGSLTLFFFRNFEMNTNALYTWQQGTSNFASGTAVLLWNSYISRNFLHDKLVAKFQFNNMLNANSGVTRANTGNTNTETSNNILGRYWMLSVSYHFDRKFKRK